MASLELHPFLHLAGHLDTPTSIVFDLDPGDGATLVTCAEVAGYLKSLLASNGLESFPKVSGSKGLQLYVPLNTKVTYEQTRSFALAAAQFLERQHPKLIVSQMVKSLRPGKVFIDWSQNSDFKTTIGIYEYAIPCSWNAGMAGIGFERRGASGTPNSDPRRPGACKRQGAFPT